MVCWIYQSKYVKANFTCENTSLICIPKSCSGGNWVHKTFPKWEDKQYPCSGNAFPQEQRATREETGKLVSEELLCTEVGRETARTRRFFHTVRIGAVGDYGLQCSGNRPVSATVAALGSSLQERSLQGQSSHSAPAQSEKGNPQRSRWGPFE